jgi:8-oxo-dGTP diphosphatase
MNPSTRFENIDWTSWTPQERATLLFIRRDGLVLLIRKKRGLGAGKINGPGGRIDGEETPLQCAIREVEEELHVTPFDSIHLAKKPAGIPAHNPG